MEETAAVKTLRVLLIQHEGEDAQRVLEALSRASAATFDVLHMQRASEACERLREEQFDVVLLDPTLPDDWGFDSFIRIRAQAPLTPLVVIAALDEADFAREAIDAGAADSLARERLTTDALENVLIGAVQRHLIEEAIERQSMIDSRTALYNRRGFEAHARQLLKLASHAEKALLIFHASIGELGKIREQHGDAARLDAIREAGRLLKETFRESDVISRFDNDDFVALAIVHPEDDSTDVVSMRFDELVRAHAVREHRPYRLALDFAMMKFTPNRETTFEEMMEPIDVLVTASQKRK